MTMTKMSCQHHGEGDEMTMMMVMRCDDEMMAMRMSWQQHGEDDEMTMTRMSCQQHGEDDEMMKMMR